MVRTRKYLVQIRGRCKKALSSVYLVPCTVLTVGSLKVRGFDGIGSALFGPSLEVRICIYQVYDFFGGGAEYKTFLLWPRVFSRALGCGARRGLACTPRCKCGSRAASVARALGVQNRGIWRVTTGSLCDESQPTRPVENPHCSASCC